MMRIVSLIAALSTAFAISPAEAQSNDPCADHIPQPKPQNSGREIVGQELDQIIDQGHMMFAVYEDYPPYSFQEDGQPRGVDVDIATLIAADIGVEARFNFVGAGENLQADLRNNLWQGALIGGRVANVMMRVPYDSAFACRVEQVVFTGQYANEAVAIAYRKDAYPDEKPIPAYFRFDTVAVENDSIADFYLSSLAGGQLLNNIRRFDDVTDAMKALANGDTKAAMAPRSQLEFGLTDALDIHQPPLPGFSVGQWTLGVGINFQYRPLAYAVDDAIRYALDDGRVAQIYAHYGLSFLPPVR